MRAMQVIDGAPISARAQSRGSREHSAEIWCVDRPINYESSTVMSEVYLPYPQVHMHIFLCLCILALVHRLKSVFLVFISC